MGDLTNFLVGQLTARGVETRGVDRSGPYFQAFCIKGHDRETASLTIWRDTGSFHCFGCGLHGRSWNELAALIGAKELHEKDLGEGGLPDPFELLQGQLERSRAKENARPSLPWDVEPWKHGSYRGLSPVFLQKLQAQRWYDLKMKCHRILWPIYQEGALEGWVARRLDDGKERKYKNSPGLPAKKILFPYDFVRKHFDCSTVVLVEGPMDALRLNHLRIPAVAIMGTQNWGETNLGLLLNIANDFEFERKKQRFVICTDGDAAGKKCRYGQLEPALRQYTELEDRVAQRAKRSRRLRTLWNDPAGDDVPWEIEHYNPPSGEDPGSMGMVHVEELRGLVNEEA